MNEICACSNTGIVQRGSSLELPFLLFGLGETPNFIEHLTVGTSSNGEVTYHRWSLLIPNSQIIVIPRPPNDPDRCVYTSLLVGMYVLYAEITLSLCE